MPVVNRIAASQPEIVAWRRDFHRAPRGPLRRAPHRRHRGRKLRAFGCDEVVEGIGRTGVVGVIRGRAPARAAPIGLRADMDALPMPEETGAVRLRNAGAMHACGHDGHTAMLLGAACCSPRRAASTARCVIFQPAEEGGGGGARWSKTG